MENMIEKVFIEYGIVGLIFCYGVFVHYQNHKADLEDRKANREVLQEIKLSLSSQETALNVHETKIKNLEKEVFKKNIRNE